jgi:AAA+ ATPase superfamily predicted ATPase
MNYNKPDTPFPTVGYYGPDYFCDREKEIESLITNIRGGQSTTLVSIRRMGKTGLINHLKHTLSDKYIFIYADILPTENLHEFLNKMASSILNSVPEKSSIGEKIWHFIKSLRTVFTFDPLTGEPQVSFHIQPKESDNQVEHLFAFLEKQEKRVIIAIDEFQQICEYPEKNVEAWLRSIIQQLTNITFIFSGSQQHLMNDMFSNPSKPFFGSTVFMHLDKIGEVPYTNFIINKFLEGGKIITEEVVKAILKWTNRHTFYVQLACNRVFLNLAKTIDIDLWHSEAKNLLNEQEYLFFGYRDVLTKHQWKLLRAIAFEGEATSLTSKEFVQKHNLGSPATVLRSLESIQKKNLIFSQHNENGTLFYSVYNVLFERWIQNQTL